MKAITVKYISPSNVKGARLKAFDMDNNSVTIPYPHDLDGDAKYRRAAKALCDKMGWKGSMVSGGTKEGEVFVFSPCLDACRGRFATQRQERGKLKGLRMQAKIEIIDGKIEVTGPYSEDNNEEYRVLAGKFANGKWVIPDTDTARAKIAELFGEKSDDVTVSIPSSKVGGGKIVQIGGYVLASRRGRDYPVQLAPGCMLASGSFSRSGGSVKSPRVGDAEIVYHLTVRSKFAEAHGLQIVTQSAPEVERLSI